MTSQVYPISEWVGFLWQQPLVLLILSILCIDVQ